MTDEEKAEQVTAKLTGERYVVRRVAGPNDGWEVWDTEQLVATDFFPIRAGANREAAFMNEHPDCPF